MIIKLICWLWGHKAMSKVYSGKTIEISDPNTENMVIIPTYNWQRNYYCKRCGNKLN